ncbi:thiohydroximate-O-sulfate sulfur/sulfate-lyase (nitrile-forming) NSP5 [Gastrolobium bilobum]|uniref:thiohydroximate-O-sulfate sulfur/sulfate-lyase (nitrile-forming) NSP5 n=1 Tax=Gastrolobium bilobum TaxID=150636 RepID=UPI002AB2CFF7|nr:thiohydroximate-O-sulfate sulfur/sulfate-lyase (nitrile-forming) NSP5 [Gastrolobium bilobum]
MTVVHGNWVQLDQKGTGQGARSSHAIATVGQKVYAFGGEFEPRVPVDNKVHVFDLETLTWSVADVSGDTPPPRVGVTMAAVGETIYVFGGRDVEHTELNEFYSFDTTNNKWALISSGDVGPPNRSYHSTTSDEQHIYIFGGCGVNGRLNDLWAFDVVDNKWVEFPSPGENCKGRGGPGLVVAQGKIWVVYGFAGKEVDDVHCFDMVHKTWSQVETSGDKPTARSVFCTFSNGKHIIVYGGEIDPSDLGHMGAGQFSGEVYALDIETLQWERLEDRVEYGAHPGPRGWCAFSGAKRDGIEGLLVFGGNSPTNDRLDDIHFFALSQS